jgi:acyl-CoA reductase-like NAD-dependent aldehyde dehydrogenase
MSTLETPERAATQNGGGAAGQIPVENPATGQIVAHVPDVGAEEVAQMAATARAAQPAWDELGFDGRAKIMYRMRRWLVDNRERVARTVVEETGKTPEDARLADVLVVLDALGFWARRAEKYLADERVRSFSPFVLGKKMYVRYRPHPVVGVIGPWNYPVANCFGDAIPALMAGCAVILKPSEVTPLSSLLIAEGMKEAGLPDGVMQVATGRGPTGAALIDAADMIMFTGSVATGRKVGTACAERLKPFSLELGGKDPMIVLRDANLERAANAAVYWAYANGGQICQAVERVYVEEPVYDEFVGKVVEKTRKLRQGAPGDWGEVDVGAVTFAPQVDIIRDHLEDAVQKGAKVLVGGHAKEGPGRFFEPTVVTDVDHSMKLMQDETFGPVLPVMKVRDEDEAIAMANDSRYGLNSSVWTKDIEKGMRIAERVEAGNTCVNDTLANYGAHELPFGGVKESGIGVRHSARGIQKYCTTHSILVTRFAPKRELYFYPYTKRGAKLMERVLLLLYGRSRKAR